MPLTEKGSEIKNAMEKEYGGKKGEQVFYASKNAGKITGVDAQKMDRIMDSVGKLAERFDSMEKRCDAVGVRTADVEKKWQIRGEYPDGKKLAFTVLAFDHSDAKQKAEKRKGGAKITDVVLIG